MLELVDQLLKRFEVPHRNRKFVKESAHILACALRSDPNFSRYGEKEVALFAVAGINWDVRTISRRDEDISFYKGLEDMTKEERQILKKMEKVPSSILSASSGCFERKNANISIGYVINRLERFIIYDADRWDELAKEYAAKEFGFI